MNVNDCSHNGGKRGSMSDTKEKILTAALGLFAEDGYEAVSVSRIAGKLGMTKGALYRHYRNKRAIFESIVEQMSKNDYDRAKDYEMPGGPPEEGKEDYKNTAPEKIRTYAKAQFRYWTEEAFSADFRKLLTLEQYRNPEMAELYQQYLAGGPLRYMADVFSEWINSKQDAMQTALAFYSPLFLLYSVYDNAENKENVKKSVDQHIDSFINRFIQERIGCLPKNNGDFYKTEKKN